MEISYNEVKDIIDSNKCYTGGFHERIDVQVESINYDYLMNMLNYKLLSSMPTWLDSKENENIKKIIDNEDLIAIFYASYLYEFNEKQIEQVVYNFLETIETHPDRELFYCYLLTKQYNIKIETQFIERLILNLSDDLYTKEFPKVYWEALFLCDLYGEGHSVDAEVINLIKKEIENAKSKLEFGMYELDDTTNIWSTFFCRAMLYELNDELVIKRENHEAFLDQLYQYKSDFGGYSIAKGERPNTIGTFFALLMEKNVYFDSEKWPE